MFHPTAFTAFTVAMIVLSSVKGCLRMVGDPSPVIPPPCGTCSLTTLRLVPGDNVNTVTPTTTKPTVGADGCQHMTATCDATATGDINAVTKININGASSSTQDPQSTINIDLMCMGGIWTLGGNPDAITSVSCELIKPPPCQLCDKNTFMAFGTPTPTLSDPTVVGGCRQMTFLCPTNGGDTYTFYNDGEAGGSYANGMDIMDVLTCNDMMQWMFINTVVMKGECLAKKP